MHQDAYVGGTAGSGGGGEAQGYRIELDAQQALFLTRLLPTAFSFQLETRTAKRAATALKSSREEPKAAPEARKKSKQEQPKPAAPSKSSSARSTKNNNSRYSEQIENAVYQKYNAQKQIGRRNSYENVSQSLRPCIRILTLLKNSKTSWPFREPVDPIALGIPHYTEIVKQPMDLSTIEQHLRTNQYVTPTQFHADVSRIITNSYTFNSSNIEFTRITAQFEAYYRKITTEGELPRGYSQNELPTEVYREKTVEKKAERKKEDHFAATTISMAEKKELGLNIKKLPKEHMKGILDIVNEGKVKIIGEFDLKELDANVIRKLQQYVRDKLSGEAKKAHHAQDRHKDFQEHVESSFELDQEDES